MSNALAYAMLLIHQHQAHNLNQQHILQQLFLTFLAGQLTADQYERDLDLTLHSDLRAPLNASAAHAQMFKPLRGNVLHPPRAGGQGD
jgi:hypothetical protein